MTETNAPANPSTSIALTGWPAKSFQRRLNDFEQTPGFALRRHSPQPDAPEPVPVPSVPLRRTWAKAGLTPDQQARLRRLNASRSTFRLLSLNVSASRSDRGRSPSLCSTSLRAVTSRRSRRLAAGSITWNVRSKIHRSNLQAAHCLIENVTEDPAP